MVIVIIYQEHVNVGMIFQELNVKFNKIIVQEIVTGI